GWHGDDRRHRIASSFSTLTPTVYIGKGFGDLPESVAWLRPLTISATAAVAMPTDPVSLTTTALSSGATTLTETINPKILQLGFALEYSLVTNQFTGAHRTATRTRRDGFRWLNSQRRRHS